MKKLLILLLIALSCFSFNNLNKLTPFQFNKNEFFPTMPMPSEYTISVEGAILGRYLFYDSILSDDLTKSCATCHKLEYAFTDQLSLAKGKNGLTLSRNTLPLFNLAWYKQFFWDGRASTIEDLIFHPVRDSLEMNLSWQLATERINQSEFYSNQFKNVYSIDIVDSNLIARAIGEFLRTLISQNSKYDQVLSGKSFFTDDEFDGFVLVNDMSKGDCLHCHPVDGHALTTTGLFSNNGLDSVYQIDNYKDKGLGKISNNENLYGHFKIPSLRNLLFTAPYMHDGRFKTLEEVIDFYSDGVHNSINVDTRMLSARRGGAKFNKEEKKKIIAFLMTLNDSSFINNSFYKNPFN